MTPKANNRPMLNVYPDSLGGTLHDVAALLGRDEMRGAFSSLYVLPSLFHSDLDRGFSVIDSCASSASISSSTSCSTTSPSSPRSFRTS